MIATVALVFGASGVGYATHVATRDSVVSTSIRDGQVKGRDLSHGAVDSARVRDDSLSGADINEATLGTVPFAAVADSADSAGVAGTAGTADAVDGMSMKSIIYRGEPATGPVVIFQAVGLSLTASCSAIDQLTITASSAVNNAIIRHGITGDYDLDIGEAATIVNAIDPDVTGQLVYVDTTTGRQAAVTFAASDQTTLLVGECFVAGMATFG